MTVLTLAAGIDFPHAAQAMRIRRRPRRLDQPKRWSTETVYAITDLRVHQAKPSQLAAAVRGHWSIENKLHWVRDVTYDTLKWVIIPQSLERAVPRTKLAAVLTAACDTMTHLAVYPSEFEADATGAQVVAVMNSRALATRSQGPYSRNRLPLECLSMAEWISLRWSVRPERPELATVLDNPWPRLIMALPSSAVRVTLVVPEDAPPGYRPPRGDVTLDIAIKMALELVARSVDATGTELPIRVRLTSPPRPGLEDERAGLSPDIVDSIPPVMPTVELDRHRCSTGDRRRHTRAMRSVSYSDQPFEKLPDAGFSTVLGFAQIRAEV